MRGRQVEQGRRLDALASEVAGQGERLDALRKKPSIIISVILAAVAIVLMFVGVEHVDASPVVEDPDRDDDRCGGVLSVEQCAHVHVVNLEWSAPGKRFTTALLIMDEDRDADGNTEPLIYDSMTLGVVEALSSNSCVDIRLNWLWGGLRGRIFFDLISVETMCSVEKPTAYLDLGDARLKFLGDSSYSEGTCSIEYSYAYATPIARISYDVSSLKFSIDGVGTSSSVDKVPCVVNVR